MSVYLGASVSLPAMVEGESGAAVDHFLSSLPNLVISDFTAADALHIAACLRGDHELATLDRRRGTGVGRSYDCAGSALK